MLRNLLWVLLIIAALIVAAVLAALNPDRITVSLGLVEVETVTSLALLGAFIVGWLFGVLCVAVGMLRLLAERRRLRRSATRDRAEIEALRRAPMRDAD